MEETIEKAIKILKEGGIVIFPTDTTFGIGCRMDDTTAVKRLFEIRKRPESMPILVLVDSIDMAKKYLKALDSDVENLMRKHWPGALTVVYRCKTNKVPSLVRGGGQTLGVRMPDHEISLELIKRVGVPILGPSANFHREKTPYSFDDLNPNLIKLTDYVLPGETNSINMQSTVIDCSNPPFEIIRKGAIKLDS